MKISHFAVGLLMSAAITSSLALMPPKYLSVPHWKQCVSTQTQGSAQFICLPDARPLHCPRSSWKKLNHQQLVNKCSK